MQYSLSLQILFRLHKVSVKTPGLHVSSHSFIVRDKISLQGIDIVGAIDGNILRIKEGKEIGSNEGALDAAKDDMRDKTALGVKLLSADGLVLVCKLGSTDDKLLGFRLGA